MITTGRTSCPRCGAGLRRGQRPGTTCGPCRKAGPDPRRDLPPGFYLQDRIVAALAGYDFGALFREIRAHTGWSQQTLGNLLDLDQSRISAIERGASWLCHVRVVARIATVFGIPAELLGFSNSGVTLSRAGATGRKGENWMLRRDFTQHIAGLALGAAGVAGLDIDRLLALLPQADPAGFRHVGVADVDVIEQATAEFVRQDFAHGSGLVRDAAVAQLGTVLPLLGAEVSSELRPRLMIATARLAMQAGWMSFEVQQHEAARRLWVITLNLTRAANHPLGADQTVYVLYDMAIQAVHLGRPDEALQLVQIGHGVAAGRYPVSESTTCALANIQARGHAARGDAVACDRALGQAVEHFTRIDPASRAPWGAFLDETSLAALQGAAHYTLALTSRDPRAAGRAVPLLRQAVDHFGPDYARPRGLYLPDLSGAYALAGDVGTAVTIGHQAVDAISALSSPRAYHRLRVLNTALEPLHTSPGVPDLRARITATAA
ncbi:MAG: helix-turn-helix domain-containing protein [Pseudonocardiaceae bacterium]